MRRLPCRIFDRPRPRLLRGQTLPSRRRHRIARCHRPVRGHTREQSPPRRGGRRAAPRELPRHVLVRRRHRGHERGGRGHIGRGGAVLQQHGTRRDDQRRDIPAGHAAEDGQRPPVVGIRRGDVPRVRRFHYIPQPHAAGRGQNPGGHGALPRFRHGVQQVRRYHQAQPRRLSQDGRGDGKNGRIFQQTRRKSRGKGGQRGLRIHEEGRIGFDGGETSPCGPFPSA
mmetsp:Transcript_50680/g.107988  ORF Transcript_50680/g.107988 Transcript_50680/m.107988 type:complete len:226 (-) Transcript_50680:1219-1896(-)